MSSDNYEHPDALFQLPQLLSQRLSQCWIIHQHQYYLFQFKNPKVAQQTLDNIRELILHPSLPGNIKINYSRNADFIPYGFALTEQQYQQLTKQINRLFPDTPIANFPPQNHIGIVSLMELFEQRESEQTHQSIQVNEQNSTIIVPHNALGHRLLAQVKARRHPQFAIEIVNRWLSLNHQCYTPLMQAEDRGHAYQNYRYPQIREQHQQEGDFCYLVFAQQASIICHELYQGESVLLTLYNNGAAHIAEILLNDAELSLLDLNLTGNYYGLIKYLLESHQHQLLDDMIHQQKLDFITASLYSSFDQILHLGCAHGHLGLVRALTQQLPGLVSQPDRHGYLPLSVALMKNQTRIIEYFINQHPNSLTFIDPHGYDAQAYAARFCPLITLQNVQAAVNNVDANHASPFTFCFALIGGRMENILFLYEQNPQIITMDFPQHTNILSFAVRNHCSLEVLQWIVTVNPAAIMGTMQQPSSALMDAVAAKNLSAVQLFFQQQPLLSYPVNLFFLQQVFHSALATQPAIAKYLFEQQPLLLAKNTVQPSAVMESCFLDHSTQSIQLIMEHQPELLNTIIDDGQTFLVKALMLDYEEFYPILRDFYLARIPENDMAVYQSANILSRWFEFYLLINRNDIAFDLSPILAGAVFAGHINTIQGLLEQLPELVLQYPQGCSPIVIAQRCGQLEIADLLQSHYDKLTQEAETVSRPITKARIKPVIGSARKQPGSTNSSPDTITSDDDDEDSDDFNAFALQ